MPVAEDKGNGWEKLVGFCEGLRGRDGSPSFPSPRTEISLALKVRRRSRLWRKGKEGIWKGERGKSSSRTRSIIKIDDINRHT